MKRFVLTLFSIILAIGIFAQTKVLTKLSSDTTRFAKPVVLSIQVIAPKHQAVKFPNFKNPQIAPNLVISHANIDTAGQQKFTKLTLNLTIIPFDDTTFQIPSFPIIIGNSIYKTDSLTLTVLPIEKDSTQLAKIDTNQLIKIFDVTKPLNAPLTLKELWLRFRYWLLGLLILILLALAGYYIYKRLKQAKQNKQEPEQQLEPHELALKRLEQLRERKLYQQGKYKEFYSELSEILRQYVEQRYHINALELTTSELEMLLKNAQLFDQELYQGYIRVLKNADLVKFAKYIPHSTVCKTDLDFAFEFIEKTKPQPEPGIEEQTTENQKNTENKNQKVNPEQ